MRQVPAYFNEAQREATTAAGRLAGLEVVRLIRRASPAMQTPSFPSDKNRRKVANAAATSQYDVSPVPNDVRSTSWEMLWLCAQLSTSRYHTHACRQRAGDGRAGGRAVSVDQVVCLLEVFSIV